MAIQVLVPLPKKNTPKGVVFFGRSKDLEGRHQSVDWCKNESWRANFSLWESLLTTVGNPWDCWQLSIWLVAIYRTERNFYRKRSKIKRQPRLWLALSFEDQLSIS